MRNTPSTPVEAAAEVLSRGKDRTEISNNRGFVSGLNSYTGKALVKYNVNISTICSFDDEFCVVKIKIGKYALLGDKISSFPHCDGRRNNGCRFSSV